jgi:hypothetical protein
MELLKVIWNTNTAFNFNDDATKVMTTVGYLSTRQYSSQPATTDGALIDYNAGTVEISPSLAASSFLSFRYRRDIPVLDGHCVLSLLL